MKAQADSKKVTKLQEEIADLQTELSMRETERLREQQARTDEVDKFKMLLYRAELLVEQKDAELRSLCQLKEEAKPSEKRVEKMRAQITELKNELEPAVKS